MRSNKIELLSRELSSAMNELKELRGGRRLGADVTSESEEEKAERLRKMAEEYSLPLEICRVIVSKNIDPVAFLEFSRDFVTEKVTPFSVDDVCASRGGCLAGGAVWVDGIVKPGSRADVDLGELKRVFSALCGGASIDLHLVGHSRTYAFVHPAWFKAHGGFCIENGLKLYASRQPRPDISIHINGAGTKVLYGMKFILSNFVGFGSDIQLARDLNVDFAYDDDSLKRDVLNADFNNTEKLIQLSKNLASVTVKYNKDKETLEANKILLRTALKESVPKRQKANGRNALLNPTYFMMANGADIDVFDPVWENVGTNLLIQALGAMLRIYTGDNDLKEFLQFCIDESIIPLEAAVHGEIDGPGGSKLSYGDMPDNVWGCSITYPWMSSWTHRARMPTFKNHLGLGYRLIMDAMDKNPRSDIARTVLGLSLEYRKERLFDGDRSALKEKCRQVATNLMQRIFN